jgi:hypothetical protein
METDNIKVRFVRAAGLSDNAVWMLKHNSLNAHIEIAAKACQNHGVPLNIILNGDVNHIKIKGGYFDITCCFTSVAELPAALMNAVDMMPQMKPRVLEFNRSKRV